MKTDNSLKIQQISRRLHKIRKSSDLFQLNGGWVRFMRDAMGMSLKVLASRTGQSISTVAQIEKREVDGRVTLESLQKLAIAMDCQLVYAFVPNKELQVYLEEKAVQKATRILLKADVHMQLEDQKVDVNMKDRVKRFAAELLKKGDVW